MAGFLKGLFKGRGPGQGFREDPRLSEVLDYVLDGCEYVLGAGDGAARILCAEAMRRPHQEVLACEAHPDRLRQAQRWAKDLKNFYLHPLTPGQFLELIAREKPYLYGRDILFFLSALGGGAERRLFDEIASIGYQFQAAFLVIYGLRAPDRDEFAFATHRGRECSVKNILPCLSGVRHSLYLPNYAVRPAKRHALMGWGLATLGRNADFAIPETFAGHLRKV